jgi:hypothetical protein
MARLRAFATVPGYGGVRIALNQGKRVFFLPRVVTDGNDKNGSSER